MSEAADAARMARLRLDYEAEGLDESSADPDPFRQFGFWFADAETAGLPQPNAMALATVGPSGPSVRTVLLKAYDRDGFVFFTNYQSRKGREIERNSAVAICFTWLELHRQVRVEGTAGRVGGTVSDEYFRGRPRGAQLGASASRQSEVVSGRAVLEEAMARLEDRYRDGEVPRPEHWGGYRVAPHVFEFWQGRRNRLHDRLRYRREGDGWTIERLAP